MNARYENGWYYCWLIERREGPQPTWLGEWSWETDANIARTVKYLEQKP